MATKAEKRKNKLATARRRIETHKAGGGRALAIPPGTNFFNPTDRDEGYNTTIMPYRVGKRVKEFRPEDNFADAGELYYERTYWGHPNVGPDGQFVICPAMTFKKKCPVCEERNKLGQDPKFRKTEEGKDTLKSLRPKERQLWLVYDHDDKKKGVQLWDISFHLFGVNLEEKIKKSPENVREEREAFHDPDGGFDLRITGKEKKIGSNSCTEFFVDEFIPRKKPIDKKLLDQCFCLEDVPAVLSYKELAKLFHGEEDEEAAKAERNGDDDEDEDEDEDADSDTDDEDEDEDEGTDAEGDDDDDDIKVGDKVTWIYKKKKLTGTVKKIKGTLATVAVKGQDKPSTVELDELAGVSDEDEDEDEKPARGKKPPKKSEEDDDDEGEEEDEEGDDDGDEDEGDDDDEGEDDDDGEDESPDDEDEDDALDDEDGDDEKPKKRRRK